jgi:hypothetical protein
MAATKKASIRFTNNPRTLWLDFQTLDLPA